MHLVMDVGNTETVLALFVPGEEGVAGRWRVSTHVPRTPTNTCCCSARSSARTATIPAP